MLVVDFTSVEPKVVFLTSQVDGVKKIFSTLPDIFTSVARVFRNGNLQEEGDDYTVTAPSTITFAKAPKVHPIDGPDKIRAELIE